MADRTGPMVAVCVAPADLRPQVDGLTGAVTADPRRVDLVAAEAAALEHGLRIASAWGGWLLAVAAGPVSVAGVLAEAAALGAEVVRVEPPGSSGPGAASSSGIAPASGAASTSGAASVSGAASASVMASRDEPGPEVRHGADLAGDPAALARALAGAILSRGTPQLVICGDRSGVHGVGAVPGFLAHELGVDQALGLVSVSPAGDGLLVERRLDGGWRERLAVSGPAVISVEGAGVRLRRAPLSAALEAGSVAIPVYAAGGETVVGAVGGAGGGLQAGAPRPYRPRPRPVDPPVGDARHRLLTLTGALTNREPPRIVGPLGAAEAADELLAYLERNGYHQPE
jgi:electron transfer flavoprotein beta subunit